ncbi:hypothetical protein DNHGIG_31110 [Collibacillus ludicampi]|uniref:YlqD protein n=1 Tax=Collibacillus ludicampi TaxID=2771369 RepID=A0AAV4LJL8_9BACL|nr:YlqD family protein [Collibacillus ludicampi]GIM47562.1 hypothetical protein DNHGIG_31110 [Collibacillus ludicampi]
MDKITIRQPVMVKFIVTEQTKQLIVRELQQAITNVGVELDQLEFHAKRALEEAKKQGLHAVEAVQQQIESERKARLERREQLMAHLTQIQQAELGSELPHGQVETTIEVKVGDSWEDIMRGGEIVLKDGIVHEIRRVGGAH